MKDINEKMLIALKASKTDVKELARRITKVKKVTNAEAHRIIADVIDGHHKFDADLLNLWAAACHMTTANLISLKPGDEKQEDDEPETTDIDMNFNVTMPGVPSHVAPEMKEMIEQVFMLSRETIQDRSEEIAKAHGLQRVDVPRGFENVVAGLLDAAPDILKPLIKAKALEAVIADRKCDCDICREQKEKANADK